MFEKATLFFRCSRHRDAPNLPPFARPEELHEALDVDRVIHHRRNHRVHRVADRHAVVEVAPEVSGLEGPLDRRPRCAGLGLDESRLRVAAPDHIARKFLGHDIPIRRRWLDGPLAIPFGEGPNRRAPGVVDMHPQHRPPPPLIIARGAARGRRRGDKS